MKKSETAMVLMMLSLILAKVTSGFDAKFWGFITLGWGAMAAHALWAERRD